MIHTPFSGTAEQRANIEKLADYVEKHVTEARFNMMSYRGDDSEPTTHTCGTVACFVGYGPDAGILAAPDMIYWDDYSELFAPLNINFFRESGDWRWLFADEWADTDNTPKGAVARARYLLEFGLPDNWYDQMCGDAPLSYTVSA